MTSLTDVQQRLEGRDPLPRLCLEKETLWDTELNATINELSAAEVTGKSNPSTEAEQAVRSGLLLWNDDLHGSHTLSQSMPSALGRYWHGIMHRREADFPNSKHWFGRAGDHPIHANLYEQGKAILPELADWGRWIPERMVDEVEAVHKSGADDSEKGISLRKLQVLEMQLLLAHSQG